MKQLHRFHDSTAAKMVCKATQPLVNVELRVEHIPCTDTRAEPAGDWVIVTDKDYGLSNIGLMNAIDQGIQHALYEALAKEWSDVRDIPILFSPFGIFVRRTRTRSESTK